MSDYKIIKTQGNNLEAVISEMEYAVKDLMLKGWSPAGGVCTGRDGSRDFEGRSHWAVQAMILEGGK
jgi:hypothetical protein